MSLSLEDLGIEPTIEPEAAEPFAEHPDHTTTSIRDVALAETGPQGLQDVIADLGVREAACCLREALHQIWGARPALEPIHVLLMGARTDGLDDAEYLTNLLRLGLPERVAKRTLTLTRRRAAAFLATRAAWQPHLADQGVGYEEMERRALLGEFDETGPVPSRFDLASLTFLG